MGERCQKSMKRGQQGQTGESSGLNGEGRDAELSGVSGRGGGASRRRLESHQGSMESHQGLGSNREQGGWAKSCQGLVEWGEQGRGEEPPGSGIK